MGRYEQRFTFQKIKSRYELIKKKYIRFSESISPLKCYFHQSASEKPLVEIAVDDSEWEVLVPPCYWGKWNANFTLRGKFNVPKDWQEYGQSAFEFNIGKTPAWDFEHPEALLFIDGKEIAGVDRNHTIIVIPIEYCDGKEHSVALHGFTGRWGSYGTPSECKLYMGNCSITCIDVKLRDFLAAVRVALEVYEILGTESASKNKILCALDKAFKVLDTCHPIAENFYSSIESAHEVLAEELSKAGDPLDVNVNAIGHSHIDVAWLWPLEQTRRKCGRSFNSVISLMEDFDEYIFTQSQPQLYDYIRQDYPDLFKKIQNKVSQGKWELIGGMWVEADCNLSGAESLARQFLLGKNFLAKYFGEGSDSPVLWLPDVFGYSANLPQLIKLAGLDYFFTIKISWNQYNQFPHESFWWQGIDGTKVLTHFGTTRPSENEKEVTYNGLGNPCEFYNTWSTDRQKEDHNEYMACFGYGDGGGGPTREMLENIQELKHFPGMPKVTHGKVVDFFESLNKSSSKLPTWAGELYLECHRGTYTTQANNKKSNRKSEFGLHDAEFLSSFAACFDKEYNYPYQNFTKAWELVCLNQFHDIIPGSSIPEVYVDSAKDYQQIKQIINEESAKAISLISAKTGGDVLLINPTSFTRNDLAVLELKLEKDEQLQTLKGEILRTQQSGEKTLIASPVLEPLSVTPLIKDKKVISSYDLGLKISKSKIENNYVSISLSDKGDIVSVFDKVNSREIVPAGKIVNEILAFEDRPLAWDAWDIDVFYDDKVFIADPAESIEVVEDGPLRATLKINRKILNSNFTQRISLAYNSPQIDFETDIDWQDRFTLLKAAFPVDILASEASYEIQWGHVKRPTHQNTSWDWARFESCAQKWVDLSEDDYGVSLLNDCKYGHDIQGNVIRITLLRSPGMPDSDADRGKHNFKYSFLPHKGSLGIRTIESAYCLNDPIIPHFESSPQAQIKQQSSLFKVDKEGVVIETIKKAENGDGFIVRIYNSMATRGNVRLTAAFDIEECYMTNILESDQKVLPTEGNLLTFAIKPFQIIGLRIKGK